MENEVSGIAKLGIVLIALAVLIGLGFGIFQISKGTANTGVNNVQGELDSVSTSQFTTYDQTTITGQMVRSAVQDFEGEQVAVLIATQAWMNLINDGPIAAPSAVNATDKQYTGSGIKTVYDATGDKSISLPIVYAFNDNTLTTAEGKTFVMKTSKGVTVNGSFINYNAILGMRKDKVGTGDSALKDAGLTASTIKMSTTTGDEYHMAGIYFDTNKFVCTSGFAADDAGRVQYNNITKNIQQTGTTEFVPTGAKFQSYLIKDASGTIMGIACQQVSL